MDNVLMVFPPKACSIKYVRNVILSIVEAAIIALISVLSVCLVFHQLMDCVKNVWLKTVQIVMMMLNFARIVFLDSLTMEQKRRHLVLNVKKAANAMEK